MDAHLTDILSNMGSLIHDMRAVAHDIQNDGDNRWNYTQMVANNKEIMMMTIG